VAASRGPDFSGPRRTPRPRTPPNADTTTQPEGLTRRALLNILEAFFRRPWLHLIPLILLVALGAARVLSSNDEFRSVGTLSVTNESLLSDLTEAANNTGFGFETPATVTARQINELFATQEFLGNVLAGAELEELVQQNPRVLSEVQSAVSAVAAGDSIVRVGAVTRDGELSRRLAQATIDSYRAWVIDSYVSQSTSTERSLEQRVEDRTRAVTAANNAVTQLIEQSPNVPIEDRSPADQLEYQRRLDAAGRAQTKLEEAQDQLDTAALQSAEAAAVVDQRVRILDEPSLSLAAEGRMRQAAMTMILFGTVGLLLSIGTVIVAAMLDRTIRVPDDITAQFGLDVLAVVPSRGG
jgi:capsular polysaccharide biosynthesis protein